MDEWQRIDNIVKMWIYGTLSPSLLQLSSKRKPNTLALWCYLESLFRANKDSKAMQLDTELRNISMGNLFVTEYCTKIQTLADLLENLDAEVPKKNIVIYIINGLSPKYDHVVSMIRHQKPLPSFSDTRSILQVEEQCIQLNQNRNPGDSSSPTVLHAGSPSGPPYFSRNNNIGGRGAHGGRGNRGGRNGGKGGRHGGSGPPQNIPARWGFGWYPLLVVTGSFLSSQHAGLLPLPIQHRPTTQQPTWPNNSQQQQYHQSRLSHNSPQQAFTTSIQQQSQPTPPWTWFGPPTTPQQQSQPTSLPEFF
ncbi:hypothetical protein Lser_V15G26960 [Lactuca serriola]